MINDTDLLRLATMTNVLRPDWPTKSIHSYLHANHSQRPYRDIAVALAWIAADPNSRTPKRLEEAGPWWDAVAAGNQQAPATPDNSALEGRCRCGQWTVRGENHACKPLGDNHAGAAAARQALAAARTRTAEENET